ncbi:MAG: cupin domain-containing protein [Anaerolineales bacterium]
MKISKQNKVVTVRSKEMVRTRQQLQNFVGISEKTAGATGLCMHMIVIPPGGAALPHIHDGYETAIYVIKGRAKTCYGEGLSESVINEAGDFIFIPANVPHQPVNISDTEEVVAIVARNDPNEQEKVIPYEIKPDDPV